MACLPIQLGTHFLTEDPALSDLRLQILANSLISEQLPSFNYLCTCPQEFYVVAVTDVLVLLVQSF